MIFNSHFTRRLTIGFIVLFISLTVNAQLRLPRLISHGMVLQREAPVKIWGWSAPGKEVQVDFGGISQVTVTKDDGKWQMELPSMPAGGPLEMTIISGDTIVLNDILIGDVWVCSGQSQMDMTMYEVSPLYREEFESAGNPMIRYFSVPTVYNFNAQQQDLPSGTWESVSQENINSVSAIAWFFASELHQTYRVPVGIIRSSLGGSPAESWMSEEALKAFPVHFEELQKLKEPGFVSQIEQTNRNLSDNWYSELNQTDKGHSGLPWYLPSTDISSWTPMEVPGYWADTPLGQVNGVLWFRKDIELPAGMAGQPASLLLGSIVDADSVFINGAFVGTTSYQYPPRRYTVGEGILKEGLNTIVIRVINNSGRGGFVPDKAYELTANGQTIDLAGTWLYKVGALMPPKQAETFIRWKPAGLYNGMLAPLFNFAIRGVVWFQGESNTGRPTEYETLFPAMIQNWRESFQQGDFPFLYAQLYNFMPAYDHPTESNWAQTREAQRKTLYVPNTAMAVTIDIGEWNDLHPLNKKDVAHRLFLAARRIEYNEEEIVASGPMVQSYTTRGNKVEIAFTETGSGLMVKGGGKPAHFAIAGADGKYVWARTKLKNDRVIVWHPDIKNPVSVRYAWADNPQGANLYNKEGLPASPFQISIVND